MTAVEETLYLPWWAYLVAIAVCCFWAGYPIYVRPRVERWRRRRKVMRRINEHVRSSD